MNASGRSGRFVEQATLAKLRFALISKPCENILDGQASIVSMSQTVKKGCRQARKFSGSRFSLIARSSTESG